jgi:hypothetical protein
VISNLSDKSFSSFFNDVGQINENISYNDSNGIFTGNWNSTIVGSFENVTNIDTSYQTSLAYIQANKNEITGWGEDDVNYDLINNEFITNPTEYNEYDCITNDPYWPLTTKDKRNIFISISSGAYDHNEGLIEDFSSPDDQTYIATNAHRRSKDNTTIGFGNCYLSSYRQSASVGSFIVAEVSYVAENMLFQMSGSGASIPYIDPKTYVTNTGIKFNIPSELASKNPVAALQPGDINLEINSSGYGLDLSDVKIQAYEFSFDFARENMDAIGYKLPLDREINLPLIASLSIDVIVGDHQYDDLSSLVRQDAEYNVIIKCKNPCNYQENYQFSQTNHSSDFEKKFEYVAVYEFSNLKFENINYQNQIGSRKTATLSFTTENDIEDYAKGLKISGILGIEKVEDFVLIESGSLPALPGAQVIDGTYLLQEDENALVTNLQVLY